jgi:hypothetical protein
MITRLATRVPLRFLARSPVRCAGSTFVCSSLWTAFILLDGPLCLCLRMVAASEAPPCRPRSSQRNAARGFTGTEAVVRTVPASVTPPLFLRAQLTQEVARV